MHNAFFGIRIENIDFFGIDFQRYFRSDRNHFIDIGFADDFGALSRRKLHEIMRVQSEKYAVDDFRRYAAVVFILIDDQLFGTAGNEHFARQLFCGIDRINGNGVTAGKFQPRVFSAPTQRSLHHIRLSDKTGDKGICRTHIDILRTTALMYDTAFHNGDPVGNSHSFFLIVSYIDRRYTDVFLYFFYDGTHFNSQLRIEIRQGFIHKQNIRLYDKSAGKGDTLLLSARQSVGHSIGVLVDVHEF